MLERFRASLASLGPTGYSYLGGVLFSLGINLLTEALAELFSGRSWTPFVTAGTVSGGSLVLAAFLCHQLVRNCEWIRERAEKKAEGKPVFVVARDAAERNLKKEHFKVVEACAAFGLVGFSLIVWVLGYCVCQGDISGAPSGAQPTPTALP